MDDRIMKGAHMTISGERIKKLREANNYSQIIIAQFLGVDQSLISKIEKGERVLSSSMLDKLATLYGITVNDFVEGNSDMLLKYALRSENLTEDDLLVVYNINKIALNSRFLSTLLKGKNNDK